ncbi:MAG: S1 family peptidase [Polyangiaceae bacterium]|nr:S1 family peptidase [Polyangiaceae bacterium]
MTLLACQLLSGCALLSTRRPVDLPTSPRPASGSLDTSSFMAAPEREDTDNDAIVRIVSRGTACTGTLVAPQLVLTAHHCVAARDDYGEIVARDIDPEELEIEVGGDYLPWRHSAVREVLAPPCGYRTGIGDLAILVLETPIHSIVPQDIELGQAPVSSQPVEIFGFGSCATSAGGLRRHLRAASGIQEILPSRFRLSAAICPGDSGGPVLDLESQKLIGVVSASDMDGQEATLGPTEITRIDRFGDLFALGSAVADGASAAELPPVTSCPGR